jgi:hypothetical protein
VLPALEVRDIGLLEAAAARRPVTCRPAAAARPRATAFGKDVYDHPSFLRAARAMPEADGWEVVGVAPETAVREAERLHPDVVLLDVQLPEVDGFEVAAAVASASPRSHRL